MQINKPFTARFQILSVFETNDTINIQGLFSEDTNNYNSTDVQVGDIILDNDGKMYPISNIINDSSVMTVEVNYEHGSVLPIIGVGVIFRQYGCSTYPIPHKSLPLDLRYFINNHNLYDIYEKICNLQNNNNFTFSSFTNQIIIQESGNNKYFKNNEQISLITENYTIINTDKNIIVDSQNNDVLIDLPSSPLNESSYFIKRIKQENNVIIKGNGNTIDGNLDFVLISIYDSIKIKYLLNQWLIF